MRTTADPVQGEGTKLWHVVATDPEAPGGTRVVTRALARFHADEVAENRIADYGHGQVHVRECGGTDWCADCCAWVVS